MLAHDKNCPTSDKDLSVFSDAAHLDASVLKALRHSFNDIGDTGAEKLANALPANRSLEELNLSGNQIGDVGAAALNHVSLEQIQHLLSEEGRTERAQNANMQARRRARPRRAQRLPQTTNTTASMQENAQEVVDGVLHAGPQHRLDFVQVPRDQNIVASVFSSLRKNTRFMQSGPLQSMSFKIGALTSEGLDELLAFVGEGGPVSSLSLTGALPDANGVKKVAEVLKSPMVVVHDLDLCWNSIDDAGAVHLADALAVNTSLRTLNLTANRFTDVGARALVGALNQNGTLSRLYVDSNFAVRDGMVEFISKDLQEEITHLTSTRGRMERRARLLGNSVPPTAKYVKAARR